MLNEIFILVIYLALAFTFNWAFRKLPDERWQIIGCFPYRRLPGGEWQGWNLTWYGFFNAVAVGFAVCLFLILAGSLNVPVGASLLLLTAILAACMPAAKIVAFLVEKKKNTFTIGGASFIGILIAPWVIWLANYPGARWFNFHIPMRQTMAAMMIAYAFGEGIGRLACISFGCCYGKLLSDCPPLIQRIFRRHSFVFQGKTKKIAYAHSYDGRQVVPIQAVTAVLYSFTGVVSCYLFLLGFTMVSFILALAITQLWRAFSEFLRADYRGEGKISGYQIMSLIACIYGAVVTYLLDGSAGKIPFLASGLENLWNPAVLIFMLVLWIIVFVYMGKSRVTSSLIDIKVQENRI